MNIIYIILNEDMLHSTQKELGLNLCGILFIDPGILCSSLFSLLITKYIIPK